MTKPLTVELRSDTSELSELLERLCERLQLLGNLGFNLPDLPECLFTIDSGNAPAGAGVITVRLKPSDRLRDYAAAMLAVDVE